MENFLTWKLWFGMYPGPLTAPFNYVLVGIIIAFILLAAVATIQYRKYKKTLYRKIWNSLYGFAVTGVIIGALLWFFSAQRVPFFSMRIWFVAWAVLHVVWAWYIYKRYKQVPEVREELAKKREFKRYIP